MKKIVLALAFITSLTFYSCSDDDTTESTGTTSGNYWPMAMSNTWEYNGNGQDSQMKITGTKQFSGKTYFELTDDIDTDNDIKSYIMKDGAVYFMRTDQSIIESNGGLITIEGYEIPFFKDNLEPNDTWSGNVSTKVNYKLNGQNTNLTATIKYKGLILATDATEAFNDVTYTDVIKMRLQIEVVIQGQSSEVLVEYSFAKDVGPIKTHEVGNGMTIDRKLTTYSVN